MQILSRTIRCAPCATEWEALNPDYKVTINTTSTGGDRGTMIPLLNQKRAPDISYQNGTVINSDLGKDWYVELSSYLSQPNKYAPEYATWADVYGDELTGTMAADGGYYYLCLEKIPVGIVYNKQIFEEAGITKVPETFAELMEAQRLIKANTSKEAFLTTYPWFDIVLENNLFSDLVEQLDVLRPNGMVDTEELVRGYVKGIWNPGKASGDTLTEDSPVFREYLNLIETKNSYYPGQLADLRRLYQLRQRKPCHARGHRRDLPQAVGQQVRFPSTMRSCPIPT